MERLRILVLMLGVLVCVGCLHEDFLDEDEDGGGGGSSFSFTAKPRLYNFPSGCHVQTQTQIDNAEANYNLYVANGQAGADAATLEQLYQNYTIAADFAKRSLDQLGC